MQRLGLQRDPPAADGAGPDRPTLASRPDGYLSDTTGSDRTAMNTPQPTPDFEVRFEDLFHCGRWLSFPCDERGRVDIDALSPRSRTNYLFARAMVGREYAAPSVRELAMNA
jgi:hypothetical protein